MSARRASGRSLYRRLCALFAAALVASLGSIALIAQVPGRNINMVSGTTLPDGDPFLQRQNEPSVAVSTRNPQHLLAGANDYRTVDLPGLPDDLENGDAWLGVYKSTDGGQTWKSTLLPGFPQDSSPLGTASPLHGFAAGADPIVRAGANGVFFYSGIAFDRGPLAPGAVFVARFIDNNNKENGDPIAYLGTSVVAKESSAKFIDKPWLAVDAPRGDASCTINGKRIAAGNVYIVFTIFTGPGAAAAAESDRADQPDRGNERDRKQNDDKRKEREDEEELHGRIMFSRSRNCGATWSKPERISSARDVNQGAAIAIDPSSGTIYVAWRQFADAIEGTPAGIMVTHSKDGGHHFEKPVRISTVTPFDQGTTGTSFRTSAFPTIAIDEVGRVYVAWAARGFAPQRPDQATGDSRIVMSMSMANDGAHWTAPRAIDNSPEDPGHQIMPALAFAAGTLQLAYYDLREDESLVFGQFVDDFHLQTRHTIDVRSAQAEAGPEPVFTVYTVTPERPSVQVSTYRSGSRPGVQKIEQLQFNPPNLPLFKQGTVPFVGDYIDVAPAPAFVLTSGGRWVFNTSMARPPTFHIVWTDNRNVSPPRDGNWANYTPPIYTGPPLDPTQPIPACSPGQTGMRNQNVYTSRVTPGLVAGSPGNNKPLSTSLQRGFVVFAQNTTTQMRSYQLAIANQPPGGRASFSQFPLPPFDSTSPPPVTTIYATVPALSMAARTVYVTSSDPRARIDVVVAEVGAPGVPPLPGAQAATVTLNPDITNPAITNPDITNPAITNPDIANTEVVNPAITNPAITNPDITNPAITNPDITNPDITNVTVVNPDITNPAITNPDITNAAIKNPDILNPAITNPDITNGSMTDVTWTVTNNGNTAAAYSTNLFLASGFVPSDIKLQLVVYKTYKTPVVVECELKTETQNQLLINIVDPFVKMTGSTSSAATQSAAPLAAPPPVPGAADVTFWLAPGETARITVRVVDSKRNEGEPFVPAQQVAAAITPQEVNTDLAAQGVTVPPTVLPPSATTLAFVVQPSDGTAGQPIVPAVQVRATDLLGATVPGLSIALALEANPSGASLAGTITAVTNSLGIATFSSLRVTKPGTGYLFTASAAGVTPVTSASFAMTGISATACATPIFGKTSIPLGASPNAVVTGDFNGDGLRDFAVGTSSGVVVFLQNLEGFSSRTVPLGHPVRALAAADMDADGRLDLVVALGGSDTVVILRGNGAGGFTFGTPFSLPGTPERVAIADFTGDGHLDVAIVTTNSDRVSLIAADGAGGFTSAIVVPVGTAPGSVVAGDFNGDGKADLAVGNTGSGDITILVGDGNGGVASTDTVAIGFGGVTSLGFGDFNEDGILDLAVATSGDAAVRVLIGDGAGQFAIGPPVAASAIARAIVTGDFNGDGHLDVALVNAQGLSTLSGDGFGNLTSSLTNFNVGGAGVSIAPTDLNADGRADLVVAVASNQMAVLRNACGSAPTVTPTITGVAGADGWYRSDVTVEWIVTDAIGVASTNGCESSLLTAETTGQTLTCSATNSVGVTTTQSVTIKIDKTPPTISSPLVSPPPNAAGWNRIVPVAVTFTGADTGPVQSRAVVCTSVSLTDNTPAAGTVVNGACTDLAGNSSEIVPVTIRIDKDAPTIAFGPSNPPLPPGGVYNRDVIIPYTVADGLSGVASVTPLSIYVTTGNGNKVVRVDEATGATVDVYVGGTNFFPFGAAISPTNGKLYVADRARSRIICMDQTGLNVEVVYDVKNATAPNNPSATEGPSFTPNGDLFFNSGGANRGVWKIAGGAPGTPPVQLFPMPTPNGVGLGVAVTPSGEIFAVDRTGNQVVKSSPPYGTASIFIPSGSLPCTITLGNPPVPVCINGIAVNSTGDVFVADTDTRSVLRFSAAGVPLGTFVAFAAPDAPIHLQFAASGDLWATTVQDFFGAGAKVWRVSPAGVATLITPTSLDFGIGIALAPTTGSTVFGTVAFNSTSSGTAVNAADVAENSAAATSPAVTIDKTLVFADDFVVTATEDTGEGSLRQAIINANAHPGVDTITFNIQPSGAHTIAPMTNLPVVTDPAILDATSQPGYSGTPVIELSGTNAGSGANGFTISAGSSTVQGFAINRWTTVSGGPNAAGISLGTLGGNIVTGNYIGTDLAGNAAAGNSVGINVFSSNNIIGGTAPSARNVVSGNNAQGVFIRLGTSGNVVQGNFIGTNKDGVAAVGNILAGIRVESSDNRIIGNVISGGFGLGINIDGSTATRNRLTGNFIGTNASGTAILGNAASGVNITGPGNTIGGDTPNAMNVISGNGTATSFGAGINIFAGGSNVIQGNRIGTNAAGTAAIPNVNGGVNIGSSSDNIVGGTTAAVRNVISGNGAAGISVFAGDGTTATGNQLLGNYIGVTPDGNAALGNASDGISLGQSGTGAVSNSVIAGNLISGNSGAGIGSFRGGNVTVTGNVIGTNATGVTAIPNDAGIALTSVSNSIIGGSTAQARNVISGNRNPGIFLSAGPAATDISDGNRIAGNYIGTDATGNSAIPNSNGINVTASGGRVTNTVIGGTEPGAANILSGNHFSGVFISTGVTTTTIQGNFIGTNGAGTAALGNDQSGLNIGGSNNTIGGDTPAAINVISGNGMATSFGTGINIFTGGSNVIQGNRIGTNAAGTAAVPNANAGVIINNSNGNIIGGSTAGTRNIISGNGAFGFNANGVGIFGGSTGNQVIGNFIGTDVSGTVALGNAGPGIQLSASNNTIGGTTAGAGNLISGNGTATSFGPGVNVFNGSSNTIQGNKIGTDISGTLAMPNANSGVDLNFDSNNNIVGGVTAGAGNLISGNGLAGTYAVGVNIFASSSNTIQGNKIGTNHDGTVAVPNKFGGVNIGSSSSTSTSTNNVVGGMTAGARNLISGNGAFGFNANGVGIFDTSTGNHILGNFIGTDVTGTLALGNTGPGINLGGSSNTIGGDTPAATNVISGNGTATSFGTGINIFGGANANVIQGNRIGTNAAGTAAIRNANGGVAINGSNSTIVGGTTAGAGNLISGNGIGAAFGPGVNVFNASLTVIQGNRIGTDITGAFAIPNTSSGIDLNNNANNNRIGGTEAGAGNLISGNGGAGTFGAGVGLFNSSSNTIQANRIGTNEAGTAAIPNASGGVIIGNSNDGNSNNNLVGGTLPAARNLISGNNAIGVFLVNAASDNRVLGNFIGTDATGTVAIGNTGAGLQITGGARNVVGGATLEARNVISGNRGQGLELSGGAASNIVHGNYIGVDVTGMNALGNGGGVLVLSGAVDNAIGGASPGQGNVISGNPFGMSIHHTNTRSNVIAGNLIGTNAAGTASVPNLGHGIFLTEGATGNIIGGTTAGQRNVISGNSTIGVHLFGADANTVQGNFIGTDITGALALGNLHSGVRIEGSGNSIGGASAGAGNVIAHNTLSGVEVVSGVSNAIRSNAIFLNGGLGIDLGANGATPNDPGDGDAGANNLQNFPVLTSATITTSTTIRGTLNSTPSTTFTLEFFSNPSCDPSGHGQGASFIGSAVVTTDVGGNVNFSLTFDPTVPLGHVITATATDSDNNTSEFSPCVPVGQVAAPPSQPAGFVYVANCGLNCGIGGISERGNVSAYSIDGTTGALTPVAGSPFPAEASAFSVTVDPTGRFAYVANVFGGVSAYSINGATGALTPVAGSPFPVPGGNNAIAVTVDPTGRFAYTANVNSNNVSAYSIDGTTGALTPVAGSPFPAGHGPFSVTVDPTGRFAYTANIGASRIGIPSSVSAYAINGTTGALTAVPGSPFPAGTQSFSVAVDPAGQFAYVANANSNDVSAYSIDGATGALTPVSGSPFAAGVSPRWLTVDPTGKFVYTANQVGNVSAYSINRTTGALTPVAGSPFAAGSEPVSVTVDPTGQFAYVVNHQGGIGVGNVSAYVIDRTTGALTPVAGSPFPAGLAPVSVTTTATAQVAPTLPVITSLTPNVVDATRPPASLQVAGVNLTAATFEFLPASVPPAVVIGTPQINATGTSVILPVTVVASVRGKFTLVATNGGGGSNTSPNAGNTLTVINAQDDADSDGDGYPDGLELLYGSDPFDRNRVPDLKRHGEVSGPAFAVLNNLSPFTGQPTQRDFVGPAFTVLNNLPPFTGQPTQRDLFGPAFTVLNNLLPFTGQPLQQNFVGAAFSLLNGVSPVSTLQELLGTAFSLLNAPVTTPMATTKPLESTFVPSKRHVNAGDLVPMRPVK